MVVDEALKWTNAGLAPILLVGVIALYFWLKSVIQQYETLNDRYHDMAKELALTMQSFMRDLKERDKDGA